MSKLITAAGADRGHPGETRFVKKRKVIINADDFGISMGVNRAIIELISAGVVTSASAMANMPDCKDLRELKNGPAGTGVHINLTVGSPLSDRAMVRSLVNGSGRFLKLPGLLERMRRGQLSAEEVELEMTSQVVRLVDMGVRPDHINSHESILKYPFFMEAAKKIAGEYGIPAVRTYTPRKFDISRLLHPRKLAISLYLPYQKYLWKKSGFRVTDKKDSLLKPGLQYHDGIRYLAEVFGDLPEGVLEFAVHPGYRGDGDEALEGYADEREVELSALSSNEFRKILKQSGAELIRFSDATKDFLERGAA
ncbi:MAG: ChbG/HpnK family deacetylase [Nitrospiraceae bacterium]|nr:MAG: ChbG/HpnK family deacetylase [Nitrospiraceae bacterium]